MAKLKLPLFFIILISMMVVPNSGQASWKASAYSGRLRMDTGHPVTNGYVFAIDSKGDVLGYSRTDPTPGPDSGRWQIVSLPTGEKITFIGFHPKYKNNLAVEEVSTTEGYHKFNRLEINLTHSGFSPDDSIKGPLGLLALIGEIMKEVNRVWGEKEATRLTDFLLAQVPKLSVGEAIKPQSGKFTVASIKHSREVNALSLPDYPNSIIIREDKMKDLYLHKDLRTSHSHDTVVEWYQSTANKMGIPLFNKKKEPNRSSMTDGVTLYFISDKKHATYERPQIAVQIWKDSRIKFGPTHIIYQFFRPSKKKR